MTRQGATALNRKGVGLDKEEILHIEDGDVPALLPRELRVPHPWRCPRPGGMGSLSWWGQPARGREGAGWALRLFPTHTILWFCHLSLANGCQVNEQH